MYPIIAITTTIIISPMIVCIMAPIINQLKGKIRLPINHPRPKNRTITTIIAITSSADVSESLRLILSLLNFNFVILYFLVKVTFLF